MSASRSATTVIIAADASTGLACCAVSTQRIDSRSASGRWRCGVGFTPSRLQTSPPTRPRHDPLAASTAIMACTSTPYALPFLTGPRPRRRCAVVGNFTSHLSCIARTCRPAHAAPVRSDQPATSFAAVTAVLAKNRPARSSPRRLPPSRRKHTVLRETICSRIAPPLYRGADRRMSQATIPWRLLFVGCRKVANPTPAASGKQKMRGRSEPDITSVHALAPSQGQAPRGSLLAHVTGIVVHDHWKPYYTLQGVLHALCNAHHLRELKALVEIEKEDWARRMQRLLRRACHAVNLARAKGVSLKPGL